MKLTPEDVMRIKETVARYYGVSPAAMDHRTSNAMRAKPRRVAMVIVAHLGRNMRRADVAAQFGCRNHASVSAATRIIEEAFRRTPKFRDELHILTSLCQQVITAKLPVTHQAYDRIHQSI